MRLGDRPHKAREQIDSTFGKPRRVRGDGLFHAGAGLERGFGAGRVADAGRSTSALDVRRRGRASRATPPTRSYTTTVAAPGGAKTRPTPSVTIALPAAAPAAARTASFSRCSSSAAAPAIAREAAWLLPRRLAALRSGRPLRRRRAARRGGQLPRHRGLFRGARRIPRRPAGGRPGGHEPRRVGQISAELVRDGQAAVAILVRPRTAASRRSTPARTPGARRRRSPGWRSAMPSRACRHDVLWYHANYVAPSWGRRLTPGRKDRHAHLLPLLILGPARAPDSVRR